MKFMHVSDLHLGLILDGVSMLEDQTHILDRILEAADRERPEAVLIAGDVYDRQIPPTEALGMFENFLYRLRQMGAECFVLAGNHDGAERLAQYSRLMDPRIHVAQAINGKTAPTVMEDQWGEVGIYMLPFLKPAHVRRFFPEEEIASYTEAVAAMVREMSVNPHRRNVLVCHQYFTGGAVADSEIHAVGGLDNVDIAAVEGFDYVAMGHLHSPQDVPGGSRGRYCGTPLAYSFSEVGQKKSVTFVELQEKGEAPRVWTEPLHPLREVRKVQGFFREIMEEDPSQDYLQVTLLDQEEIPEVMNRLRRRFPNVLECRYQTRSGEADVPDWEEGMARRSPVELFGDLFRAQNNREMTPEQTAFVGDLVDEIWGENL